MLWIKFDLNDKSTWPNFKEEVLVYIDALYQVIIAELISIKDCDKLIFTSHDRHILDLDTEDVTYWAKIEYPPDDLKVETRKNG